MRAVRGQNAIEYMMTYGWAILVILIVGVLVWQMGILELGRNVTPDKRGFSQITPLDWVMKNNGDMEIVVQNNAGTILRIDQIGANMLAGGSACSPSAPPGTFPIEDFRPAASETLTFSCMLNAEQGEYYKVNMTITYTNPSSGLQHMSNGVVWGPVG
ncbi:MAG: hypothetical protein GF416_00440 [Candidatus Altiarchaeales archaeon]|nr:hypothetical protein [Candidatus Altiarchaeales archaeon]MBD3415588.1 hypothetical protein [Candidatus Altiarchaeales archaeon]